MDKIKQFWAKPIGKVIILTMSILVIIVTLAIAVMPSTNVKQLAKEMQNNNNKVIKGDIKLTTQETLKTIGGQETRLANQLNSDEDSRNAWEKKITVQNKKFKETITNTLKAENDALKKSLAELERKQQGLRIPKATTREIPHFIIGNGQSNNHSHRESSMNWVTDTSRSVPVNKTVPLAHNSVLHTDNDRTRKPKVIPYYTIPANTALVNVHPLQPLIGVIPTNGTVIDPETVLFSVGGKGLLANGWSLPYAIKGVQGSAICTGIFNFNHSAVKCNITSVTFIFKDGRIATVNGSSEKPLGKLTNHFGNDYIPGRYFGNAAYAAGGNAFFGGVQGWGGAFANSQVENQSNASGTFTTTMFKNANNYAAGLALQSAGQSMNNWWQKLLKSATDYVLVPNWNKSTHKLLLLNAVITSPIAINYNQTNRKVIYQHEENSFNNSLD